MYTKYYCTGVKLKKQKSKLIILGFWEDVKSAYQQVNIANNEIDR